MTDLKDQIHFNKEELYRILMKEEERIIYHKEMIQKNEAEIYLERILTGEDMQDERYQDAFLSYLGELIRNVPETSSSLNIFIFAKSIIAPHHIDIEDKTLLKIICQLYESAHLYAKHIHKNSMNDYKEGGNA
jgi:hypothetical protein